MKQFGYLTLLTALLVALGGCGGAEVDESLLPTRIPTIDPASFAVTVQPPTSTSTTEPTAEPTLEPTTEPAAQAEDIGEVDEADETDQVPALPELEATDVVTDGGDLLPTPTVSGAPATEITVTVEVTATDGIEETDDTVAPGDDAEPEDSSDLPTQEQEPVADETPAAEDTADEDTGIEESVAPTATVPVTTEAMTTTLEGEDEEIPATESITATDSITPTATQAITDTQVITDTVEAGGASEVPEDSAGDATDASRGANELPADVAAALEDANPERGRELTIINACIGCHSLDPEQIMIGPAWHNMAVTAQTRVEGQDAELYLYNSIVHPNAYINEGYPPNVMLQTYGQTLSAQDLADLIAYLLMLEDG